MFGVKAYQQVAAHTSDPWELIDQLYRGAIQAVDEGKLPKASRIVEEGLIANLAPGNPLSQGYLDSYDTVLVHLLPGGNLPTARQVLTTLHEGWVGIREKKAA